MTSENTKRALGVFSNHRYAEFALQELKNSGFPMQQVSIILQTPKGQDELVEVNSRSSLQTSEAIKSSAPAGVIAGGLVYLIGSFTTITIPEMGRVVVGGELATLLTNPLVGGTVDTSAGALMTALRSFGVPENQAKFYNDCVSQGEYLVMVEGIPTELTQAEQILSYRGIQAWGIYEPSDTAPDQSQYVTTAGIGNS